MYNFLLKIVRPFFKIFYPINYQNSIEIPDGPVVILVNHKSNLDPFIISLSVERQIHWMAKKELFSIPIINWVLDKLGAFPVDRNNNDLKSIRKAMSILKEKKIVGIFPEGTRIKNVDFEGGKSGAIMLASRMHASIVPIYIEGEYRLFKPINLYFRQPLILEAKKRSEEEYRREMKNIMEIIYRGEGNIGNHSK